MTFSIFVEVSLRPGIADPEGATIERALPALGFDGVSGVRSGKSFRFEVSAATADEESRHYEIVTLPLPPNDQFALGAEIKRQAVRVRTKVVAAGSIE